MLQLIKILRKIIAQSMYRVIIANRTQKQLDKLLKKDRAIHDKIMEAIKQIKEDFKHPSLQTHEFRSEKGPEGEKILRSMATKSYGGWRIHWYIPKNMDKTIAIVDIIKHE